MTHKLVEDVLANKQVPSVRAIVAERAKDVDDKLKGLHSKLHL